VLTKAKIALLGLMILAAPSAAMAKGSGVPNVDLQKVCRTTERQITALFSDSTNVFEACMDDEKDARDKLVKDWATIPAFDKKRCVRPMEFLPSYVEWQTCIDMMERLRKMRNEEAAGVTVGSNARARSSSHRSGAGTKQCPVVNWRNDGSIASLDAC
jgi:hypothetical protein